MGCGASSRNYAASLQLEGESERRALDKPKACMTLKELIGDKAAPEDDGHDEGPDDDGPNFADERNQIVIIERLQLYGVPCEDFMSASDPFLIITSTAHHTFRFTSTCRKNEANPSWSLKVPLLIRHTANDKITIRLQDSDLVQSDSVERLVLWTHHLKRVAAAGDRLELSGEVPSRAGTACRFTMDLKFEHWAKEYPVHASLAASEDAEDALDSFARMLLTAFSLSGLGTDKSPHKITAPSVIRQAPAVLQLLDGHITALADDPDIPVDRVTMWGLQLLQSLPLTDSCLPFASRGHGETYMQKMMEKILGPRYAEICPEGPWDDVTSDLSFTRYFFQNNGSSFMHKTPEGFVAKMAVARQFETRPAFIRYGCDVYFDNEGKPLEIDRLEGRVVQVGGEEWEAAKTFARSTAFFLTSAHYHLMIIHFIWANYPNMAMLTHLKVDHPLRRLLHVHFLKSANTCIRSTVSLFPNKGLIHRSTALTHESMHQAYKNALQTWTFTQYPDDLRSRGMQDEGKLYPMALDGMELHGYICTYVASYIDLYYQSEQGLADDQEAVAFYAMMQGFMPGLPKLCIASLKTVLAEIIFRVTGYHEHIGNVNVSGTSPVMIAPHIREGTLINDIDSALIIGVITALTADMHADTNMKEMPCLFDDWSWLLLDDQAKAVFRDFHKDLETLKTNIAARNQSRPVFNDMCPTWVQTSVYG